MELVSPKVRYEEQERHDVKIWVLGKNEPFVYLLDPKKDSLVNRDGAMTIILRNEDQTRPPFEARFNHAHITAMEFEAVFINVAIPTPGPTPDSGQIG